MSHPIEWSRLDTAAFRVSMKRSVRRVAWVEAGVGAVALACGIAGRSLPLAAIGLPFLACGLVNSWRPSIRGLLLDGVTMILSGLLLGTAWMWMPDALPASQGRWIFAGVLQIVWGVRRLALYPIARSSVDDPQAIARLEVVVADVAKRPTSDASLVTFSTGGLRKHRNRLGLFAEGVVGLLEGQAVRLETRGEIWIEARGTTLLGRTMKVRVQMSDLHLVGDMPTEHFERFERWKLGASSARPAAA